MLRLELAVKEPPQLMRVLEQVTRCSDWSGLSELDPV